MATEWQWHYLSQDFTEAATNSSTIRLKLPERDQISVIDIELRAQRLTGNYNDCMIDQPEKIEVIGDGASVLYSACPETAAFLHFCAIRALPAMINNTYPGFWEYYRVKVCFGRWERDPDYMLDTSVYQNVYLEIPWTLNTTDFVTFTFTHTIRYLRPIQKLSPKGFIRSRDIEYGAHTWTATGHYYVDLPLTYPWYMLGCRIYKLECDLQTDINHIKLDIDDGRLILVDDDTDDLIRDNAERIQYPIQTVWKMLCSGGADQHARAYMGKVRQVDAMAICTAGSYTVDLETFQGAQEVVYSTYGIDSVACPCGVNMSLWGEAYMCCVIIKDWWLNWYDPVPHAPFPVGEHSEANIDYTHAIIGGDHVLTDLRTFLQEICPLKI